MKLRLHPLIPLLAFWAVHNLPAQDFRALRYENPGLVVDLAVGLWAFPLPMDYDGDGDHDLLVACPDKPANGVYLFENPGPADARLPVFKPAVRLGPAVHDMLPSYLGDSVRILGPGIDFEDFRQERFEKKRRLPAPVNVHDRSVRANQWRIVDYDGDGVPDLVIGVGDWNDYGWDMAYDGNGRWQNGPLHGYVYWARNTGSEAEPAYAPAERVKAGGVPVDVYGRPTPNFADFDGDGDLDLLCGEFLDSFTYFENTGTRREPRYASGRRLTLDGEVIRMDLQMIVPVAFDWDRDGDVDLIVGDEDGRVALMEHTGEVVQGMPAFLPPVYFRQEADTLNVGALATPHGIDWDGDGDEDLLAGNTAGHVFFLENLDGQNPPRWAAPRKLEAGGVEIRIQAGANGSVQGPCEAKWGYTTLTAADWNRDGLADLLVNSIWGEILYYERNPDGSLAPAASIPVEWEGSPKLPKWFWWEAGTDRFVTQWRTTPVAVDWNEDGWTDLVLLDHEGYLSLAKREVRNGEPVLLAPVRHFVDESGKPLRLNSRSAGASGRSKLAVTDWDGDGLGDVLVNSENAAWFRNLGEHPAGGTVLKRMGNLGRQNLAGHTSSPTVCDWDGDRKPDLLVGSESGMIYYLPHDQTVSFDAESLTADLVTPEPADSPFIRSEFIYTQAPFKECHASTIAETSRGLAAAWFGGSHEKHPDVGIWTSYHDGQGWSRPVEAANGVQHADLRYPCWNPVLYQVANGPLILFYKCGPDPRSWWGMRVDSRDGGRTWQEPRRLPEGIVGPIKNKPVLLGDGTLLCGSSSEDQGWRLHVEKTSDFGLTWRRIGPLNDGETFGAIQPSVLFLDDGRLQLLCRSRQGNVLQSFSADQGESWSPLERSDLPNPNAGTDAVTLADGRHVIVYNHLKKGRHVLNVALSENGSDWVAAAVLEDGEGEYSYPAVVQSSDGLLHITYTWRRELVKHVVIDPDRWDLGRMPPIENGEWPEDVSLRLEVSAGNVPESGE